MKEMQGGDLMRPEEELMIKVEEIATDDELLMAAKQINKLYNMYSSDMDIWRMLESVFGEKFHYLFNQYSKAMIANKFINLLMLKYYPCERVVKYALVDALKQKHDTVLFEMPVLDSRIDVCRINGNSYAYEIKTEYDNFTRLNKQLHDYAMVYEYVYVVVPYQAYDEVVDMIPDYCGIRLMKHDRENGSTSFYAKKAAKKSPEISPEAQLSCLSKKSLENIFKRSNIMDIPFSKKDRVEQIINRYVPETVNRMFKQEVKHIYERNWNFVMAHYEEILPIDFQNFFSCPLDPELLYYKEIVTEG